MCSVAVAWAQDTSMNNLIDIDLSIYIYIYCRLLSIKLDRYRDRQTDRQTDRQIDR